MTETTGARGGSRARQIDSTAFVDREAVTRGTPALLLHPYLKGEGGRRTPEAALGELEGLARAIDLDIVGAEATPLTSIRPRTYVGEGKVEELAKAIKDTGAELLVVDAALSPGQQQKLEKALSAKVIDRTGLILEIFGERAQTREGVLQVELAHLNYQKGRLVRSWTHLERQRGGAGFLGGPGERQIEADRRVLRDKIARLRRELEGVTRTRLLHRKSREKVPYPIVALVGYTNAGKSTLFNRLTRDDVLAEDMLFATLDPTMRALKLPSGRKVILSDTVGFVSNLPTHLVAAFRATLEEVIEADIVVHVRDISHPDTEAQRQDVVDVLTSLGVPSEEGPDEAGPDNEKQVLIDVENKIDLLDADQRAQIDTRVERHEAMIPVSAATGEGVSRLLERLDALLARADRTVSLRVPYSDGALMAWLYDHGEVVKRTDAGEGAEFQVRLSGQDVGKLRKQSAAVFLEAAE
ncbi:MAG: GTPase HflX [Sphingomonadales bacterium]